jgi:hypothetical protein
MAIGRFEGLLVGGALALASCTGGVDQVPEPTEITEQAQDTYSIEQDTEELDITGLAITDPEQSPVVQVLHLEGIDSELADQWLGEAIVATTLTLAEPVDVLAPTGNIVQAVTSYPRNASASEHLLAFAPDASSAEEYVGSVADYEIEADFSYPAITLYQSSLDAYGIAMDGPANTVINVEATTDEELGGLRAATAATCYGSTDLLFSRDGPKFDEVSHAWAKRDVCAGIAEAAVQAHQGFDYEVYVDGVVSDGVFRNELGDGVPSPVLGEEVYTLLVRFYDAIEQGQYPLPVPEVIDPDSLVALQ